MGATSPPPTPERAARIVELLMRLPGIVGAKVWEVSDRRIEVGVKIAPGHSAHALLRRAQEATASLRSAGEAWHFGLLSED